MESNIKAHGKTIIEKKKKVYKTRREISVSNIRFHYSSVRDTLLNLHEGTDNSVKASQKLFRRNRTRRNLSS